MKTTEREGPRFAGAWAMLVYAVSTMALAYPALAGAFLVNPHSDQYIAGYAFRDFAAQSLRAGHGFPLWDPYLFGGLPYVAAMHGDIFYPTFLLRILLPTDQAMTWSLIVHLFLAGCFTYGLLRAWGFGFFPALFGGLAYMLSGQVASLVSPGYDGKLFVSALLPLALWMIVRGIRDQRAWAWGVLALTIGLAVLSPHPQLVQYLLLLSAAWALFVAVGPHDGAPLDRGLALRGLGLALAAVAVGVAIGAIQYLPVLEYTAFSPRAAGQAYPVAAAFSMPWEELLINSYLPQFTGMLDAYWGRNGVDFHTAYLGVVPLFLAGAAVGATRRTSFRRFWIGALIVGALWAIGGYSGFFEQVYRFVPGTRFFRAPSAIFFIVSFAVAVLAACGMERALEGGQRVPYAKGWAIGAVVLAALSATGALAGFAATVARGIAGEVAHLRGLDGYAASFATQLVAKASDNAHALQLGGWRTAIFAASCAALMLAFHNKTISPRVLALSFVALGAVDLWSIDRLYWLFSPPANTLYASDSITDYLARQAQPARVLVLGPDSGVREQDPYFGAAVVGAAGSRVVLGTGNGLMVHGIRSVTGYHGNELARYQRLLDARRPGGQIVELAPAFWHQENVNFLYTTRPITDPRLHLVAGPVRNAAGSVAYLYGLPGGNPYGWVAAIIEKGADDQTLTSVLDPRFDPNRAAIFDSAAPVAAVQTEGFVEPAQNAVTVEHYAAGAVDLALATPAAAGQALIASENYYPGWTATVDGQRAAVGRADYNLIGVALPAGARHVQLRFDDLAYERGKVVTLLALVMTLGAIVGGMAIDRRRMTT